MATTALRVPLRRARLHWAKSQGLPRPLSAPLHEIVGATGWLRTLGGVDVYLALRARAPGLRRADLDGAVDRAELQVIPAVRGCIYLVPRADVPLALRVAEAAWRPRADREHEKAGVRPGELDEVAAAVREALARGPMTTDALRRSLPEGTVRGLGEAGKKLGLSSTLPSALRLLEFAGDVERTLEGGRLDTERYLWRRTRESPFSGADVPADAAARHERLAEAFFRWCGPATLKDFAAWAGLSQRDAKAAAARSALCPVSVEGYADEALLREADLERLRGEEDATALALLPFEDNLLVSHGGPKVLVDPALHDRTVPVWGQTTGTTLGDARHMALRTLWLDGEIAGVWELDPDRGEIVLGAFAKLPAARRRAAEERARDLAAFLQEDLGHGRSFSLDTDDALRARAASVRKL